MDFVDYRNRMEKIQRSLLTFLEESYDTEEYYENLLNLLSIEELDQNHQILKSVLYLISKIFENHNRPPNFFNKIAQVLQYLSDVIKPQFTNYEIFEIFKRAELIFLFLLERKIVNIDNIVYDEMMNSDYTTNTNYLQFFQPEVEKYEKKEAKLKKMRPRPKNHIIKDLRKFDLKRKQGENNLEICKLIRNDLIEEFIILDKRNNYSLNSVIHVSKYETNPLLKKKETTNLIEYAAFYGSIQIFKYLYLNGVELKPSLWIYAIHGDNEEIIHILEENKIVPEDKTYQTCFKEAIKCHHFGMANYIESNFLKVSNKEENENNIISYSFHYYNFLFIPSEPKDNLFFYCACKYDYYIIVDYFLKTKNIDLDEKINEISFSCFNLTPMKIAARKNNIDIAYLLMNKSQKVEENCFKECKKLRKITIPDDVISIENNAFSECSLLTEVSIPLSVTLIGDESFFKCSLISEITIPSSVVSIGSFAFSECSSLKKITIPSTVASIGRYAFSECSKLEAITIPHSIVSIEEGCFFACSSLTEVLIHSSITKIEQYAFSKCSSLKIVKFESPSSITFIGSNAFSQCSSLFDINIPSSVTSIQSSTFCKCLSLKKINIPSSVTLIDSNAFAGCLNLLKICIPSSVKSIESNAFFECSSMIEVSFQSHSSLVSIGKNAFYKCLSLSKISIPSSVTSIGENAFYECRKLQDSKK